MAPSTAFVYSGVQAAVVGAAAARGVEVRAQWWGFTAPEWDHSTVGEGLVGKHCGSVATSRTSSLCWSEWCCEWLSMTSWQNLCDTRTKAQARVAQVCKERPAGCPAGISIFWSRRPPQRKFQTPSPKSFPRPRINQPTSFRTTRGLCVCKQGGFRLISLLVRRQETSPVVQKKIFSGLWINQPGDDVWNFLCGGLLSICTSSIKKLINDNTFIWYHVK